METKEVAKSSILISTFKRSKVESNVIKPFYEFSDDVKRSTRADISLEKQESEAVLSYSGIEKWLLLTSSRIFIKEKNDLRSIFYKDIDRVEFYGLGAKFYKQKKERFSLLIKVISKEDILLDIGENGAILFPFEKALYWAIMQAKDKCIQTD